MCLWAQKGAQKFEKKVGVAIRVESIVIWGVPYGCCCDEEAGKWVVILWLFVVHYYAILLNSLPDVSMVIHLYEYKCDYILYA